jgi:UDP-GlcNAc3NAcA epimerase
MPEEINRIVCDHVSTLLFSPTRTGYDNLVSEGFKPDASPPYSADNPRIYHCGDVMYDNSIYFSQVAEKRTDILRRHKLETGGFVLATIHRNNNTDEPERLTALISALERISGSYHLKVILPLHPRTRSLLPTNLSATVLERVKKNSDFIITEPVSFLEMIALEKNCAMVLTDSGGVQKEAFYFNKPCVIMRSETEWTELVECGTAILADADEQRIIDAFARLYRRSDLQYPSFYGDGRAAEFICSEMLAQLGED